QNHRAKRALRRLSAVSLPGGFSRKQATFSRNQTHRLSAGGRLAKNLHPTPEDTNDSIAREQRSAD
ncbi:MAG: hypothetical protein ACYCSN_16520, partial [Acidobacteriaceae bacterium]